MSEDISEALRDSFISPNVADSNLEAANVVDVIQGLATSARRIASAISADAAPGHDATGGVVASLTEAVMGITAGLMAVAESNEAIADAIRELAVAQQGR